VTWEDIRSGTVGVGWCRVSWLPTWLPNRSKFTTALDPRTTRTRLRQSSNSSSWAPFSALQVRQWRCSEAPTRYDPNFAEFSPICGPTYRRESQVTTSSTRTLGLAVVARIRTATTCTFWSARCLCGRWSTEVSLVLLSLAWPLRTHQHAGDADDAELAPLERADGGCQSGADRQNAG